ncbi:hypothetical protein PCCS19_15000 [Paenibacillus sp. CCS19]|nr:hypothetical protein PCCS19_15000 [Paenibacillus cellulosilyticus]
MRFAVNAACSADSRDLFVTVQFPLFHNNLPYMIAQLDVVEQIDEFSPPKSSLIGEAAGGPTPELFNAPTKKGSVYADKQ